MNPRESNVYLSIRSAAVYLAPPRLFSHLEGNDTQYHARSASVAEIPPSVQRFEGILKDRPPNHPVKNIMTKEKAPENRIVKHTEKRDRPFMTANVDFKAP